MEEILKQRATKYLEDMGFIVSHIIIQTFLKTKCGKSFPGVVETEEEFFRLTKLEILLELKDWLLCQNNSNPNHFATQYPNLKAIEFYIDSELRSLKFKDLLN